MALKKILPAMQFRQSPNWSDRDGREVIGQVIHYTGGADGRRTAGWLCAVGSRRSCHFIGFRDGQGAQICSLDRAAWHAGASEWLYKGKWARNVNLYSIGIELANHGYLYRSRSGKFYYECGGQLYRYNGPRPRHAKLIYDNGLEFDGWWEPYTDDQIQWLKNLLLSLAEEGYPVRLVGHEEISVPLGRKKDPGSLFPWDEFKTDVGPWVPRVRGQLITEEEDERKT